MFAASLPDLDSLDLEASKALLMAQHESYTATLSSRPTEIERLVRLVEKLQRILFGTTSEKVLRQIERLELHLEELQAADAFEERAAATSAARPICATDTTLVRSIGLDTLALGGAAGLRRAPGTCPGIADGLPSLFLAEASVCNSVATRSPVQA
jgi:hypothetical protein